jgi:hypothetical protein
MSWGFKIFCIVVGTVQSIVWGWLLASIVAVFQECSDILLAMEAYISRFNLTVRSAIVMAHATKRAFAAGQRISKS